jgi:hypothetical protein
MLRISLDEKVSKKSRQNNASTHPDKFLNLQPKRIAVPSDTCYFGQLLKICHSRRGWHFDSAQCPPAWRSWPALQGVEVMSSVLRKLYAVSLNVAAILICFF